ncbi:hypothetical protein RND71_005751 [Anisodus tanguticus]|uniref:BHLH domain-containing protein n=1 Tax=Anisodus tanguticus TaxID=243964 RepID=A0AAE1SQP5_9SOLA|nr:hypothetical protein RND71_005751 [Anisodus tanguticus]
MDEGGEDCFIWEKQRWSFSNSDNSGGNGVKPAGKKSPDIFDGQQLNVPDVVAGRKRTASAKGNGQENEGKTNGGESDHEMHMWTERERRKKMRNMFSNLHALLPQLPPKADKSTIVDEAVSYIKTLQHTLQKLQRQKLQRLHGMATTMNPPIITTSIISREAFLSDQGSTNISPTLPMPHFPTVFQTWTSPNVILNVCGDEAHISVCYPKKSGLLSTI